MEEDTNCKKTRQSSGPTGHPVKLRDRDSMSRDYRWSVIIP